MIITQEEEEEEEEKSFNGITNENYLGFSSDDYWNS
jgi:hypothetical protein